MNEETYYQYMIRLNDEAIAECQRLLALQKEQEQKEEERNEKERNNPEQDK